MSAPREEGAKITAHTVTSPLDQYIEHLGGQLDTTDTAPLGQRQAEFLRRRLGVRPVHANIIASLVFGEVSR